MGGWIAGVLHGERRNLKRLPKSQVKCLTLASASYLIFGTYQISSCCCTRPGFSCAGVAVVTLLAPYSLVWTPPLVRLNGVGVSKPQGLEFDDGPSIDNHNANPNPRAPALPKPSPRTKFPGPSGIETESNTRHHQQAIQPLFLGPTPTSPHLIVLSPTEASHAHMPGQDEAGRESREQPTDLLRIGNVDGRNRHRRDRH
ncbi:hypothetical protein B0T19DRAFT_219624 [Cercophora scortea]|uniref:Uncharacterized protein n=1 Tax=Cercophora scortea TaxID=314031 RepID=A0AAE0M943_9PEZI|nr:hypothetical protein B0T19DRAFT_219624 [Cercophora scortea]